MGLNIRLQFGKHKLHLGKFCGFLVRDKQWTFMWDLIALIRGALVYLDLKLADREFYSNVLLWLLAPDTDAYHPTLVLDTPVVRWYKLFSQERLFELLAQFEKRFPKAQLIDEDGSVMSLRTFRRRLRKSATTPLSGDFVVSDILRQRVGVLYSEQYQLYDLDGSITVGSTNFS